VKHLKYRIRQHYRDWKQNIGMQEVLEENERDCRFQHDGATVHTANAVIALLQEFFGECNVGRRLVHHDLQTLQRQTSLCGDFSKPSKLGGTDTILSRLMLKLIKEHFAK
jgi:hypothetical protein